MRASASAIIPTRLTPTWGQSRAVMTGTLQTCRRYAQSFTLKSGNLLLNGNPGLGKTFLSACIARTVADGGYSVVYETAVHLFSCLEEAKFTDSQEAKRQAEKYTACDLLIMDDLGTEMTTQFVSSALYTVLNDRLLAGSPTVVSTNLQSDEIARRYSPPNRLPPPGQLPVGGVCGGGHSAAKSERNIMRGHVNISKMPPDEEFIGRHCLCRQGICV